MLQGAIEQHRFIAVVDVKIEIDRPAAGGEIDLVVGAVADANVEQYRGVWRQGGAPEPAALGVIGIYQDANFTGSNSSSAQKLFNESSNGAATVASDTTYEINAAIHIDTTGTTPRTFSLGFGGTATLASIGYFASAGFSTTGHEPGGSIASIGWINTEAQQQIVGNSGANAGHYSVQIKGLVRVTTGGTFIPQYKWSVAPGAAGVTRANSFLTLTPVGDAAVTTVGAWT